MPFKYFSATYKHLEPKEAPVASDVSLQFLLRSGGTVEDACSRAAVPLGAMTWAVRAELLGVVTTQ